MLPSVSRLSCVSTLPLPLPRRLQGLSSLLGLVALHRPSGGPSLPLLEWRVSHFFATSTFHNVSGETLIKKSEVNTF